MTSIRFGTVKSEDLLQVIQLEAASYPEDEAATPEKIRYRAEFANDYFVTAKDTSASDALMGFINGTCVEGKVLTHESMSDHAPQGRTLAIHSVAVSPSYRRKGVASWLLKQYLHHIKENNLADDVVLLSKSHLLPLYLSCGFKFHKVSDVVHGRETWIELGLSIREAFAVDQWQVDAFSDYAFGGNPAAVVLIHRDASWMQNLAMENNLAETSFLEKVGEGRYKLRWFTPTAEVALCGHATLAAAHVLLENGLVSANQPVVFETVHSGELIAEYLPGRRIQLSFPTTPVSVTELTVEQQTSLLSALSINIADVVFTGRSMYDFFVEITAASFHQLKTINFTAFGVFGLRGVIVTCAGPLLGGLQPPAASEKFHFYSRCFFPLLAINEDPVTGSAHCALCPYWAERASTLNINNEVLIGRQASPRGGSVTVALRDDRVLLSGTAVTTMKSKVFA